MSAPHDWTVAAIRSLNGQGNTPLSPEQQATVDWLATRPKVERVEIHEAFRWYRTCGFRADPAEVTRLENGDVRVEQWIYLPAVGWSREVEVYNPAKRVEAMLRACPEVTGLFGPDSYSVGERT